MNRAVLGAVAACLAVSCGKQGPPLPPLVKLPLAPADLSAVRRADTVDLTVTVPATNTDGTRPANISRLDVYAITAPENTADAVVLKDGMRVASTEVKAPRDPNATVDVDDPDSDVEPPEGPGLDQGVVAHLKEVLTAQSVAPAKITPPSTPAAKKQPATMNGPLVGPPLGAPVRVYLARGLNKRGRPGPVSKRVVVPLVAPPARASEPTVTYDESAITVRWGAATAPETAAADVLPSRSLVSTVITTAYNLYEVTPASVGSPLDVKLTSAPIGETSFTDRRLDWGRERCYAVRVVELVGGMSIEGDPGTPRCVTLVDTFPPAAPKKPTAIALAGAISILWDPSEEPDLAGYLVFRGTTAGSPFTQLTPAPTDRTNFTDEVPQGFRAFYAVEAVDKAGNASPMSPVTDEETAR